MLLPPSEGKTAPRRGRPLDLGSLSSPGLTGAREEVLDALVGLCEGDPATAARVLGVTAGQLSLVHANADLRLAATARADRVYSGVLYDALDLAGLDAAARRRASSRVAITSSVFGVLRPADRVPAYRLSGSVGLPGLGSVAGHWRSHLGGAVTDLLGGGLLVDLRSGTYGAFWRPPAALAGRVATVRVLSVAPDGERSVVSHFNKHTKGLLARALLVDGAAPRTPALLGDVLRDLGWEVETAGPTPAGTRLDVLLRA